MKTVDRPQCYVSGPHSSDYYLLLDDESGLLFERRLAEHIRDASSVCDDRNGRAIPSVLEMWIDDEKHVWYAFQPCHS